MTWIVMARVSGGVTGTREAPLKDGTGMVKHFTTREAADAEARDLNVQMNHRFSVASFRYWVEEQQ